MHSFANSLAAFSEGNLLIEKQLISPSLRVGWQWLDSLTRSGRQVMNLHVVTLKGLALKLAAGPMGKEGLSLVSDRGSSLIIDLIWQRLKSRSSGYLFSLQADNDLSRVMVRSIIAIRLAGLNADDLQPECFEVSRKGKELSWILESWLDELDRRNLVDYAHVLSMATEAILRDEEAFSGLIGLPGDLELLPLEKRLLDAIPRQRLVVLTDAHSLNRIVPASRTHPGHSTENISIFQAHGEINETREVLRRCLSRGLPFDEVELLHTDTQTYVPLIYETLSRFHPSESATLEELPLTFAEGIPIRYSRPGRALSAWIDWIQGDYRQSHLARIIQDGLIEIPGMKDSEHSFTSLASLLGSMTIGFGRERYRKAVDLFMRRLEDEANDVLPDGLEDTIRSSKKVIEKRLNGLRLIREMLMDLLFSLPTSPAGPAEIIAAASSFLGTQSRCVNTLDNFSRELLLAEIRDLGSWIDDDTAILPVTVLGLLSDLVSELRVGGSGPRPGCLHVAHLLSGGHSQRPHTFIMGMDDTRFPGTGLQDPFLLDGERKKISSGLPISSDALLEKMERFRMLLTRLASNEGSLWVSFSCRDIIEDRELFPSPAVVYLYRRISGNPAGAQADLARWLSPPSAFAPREPLSALDESEWWLWRLGGPEEVANGPQAVTGRFPHLERGMAADDQRRSAEFTAYDGFVPAAGRDLDPTGAAAPALSSSRLQKLGECPLAYFFQYALRIEPPEQQLLDPDLWLDARDYGKLLHDVLYEFMKYLAHKSLTPSTERDWKSIQDIAGRVAALYREKYPPITENAFQSLFSRLLRASRIFLVEEERFFRGHRPLYQEASIGLPPGEQSTAFDTPHTMAIPLFDGRVIHVRGRIDRIDQKAGGDGHSYSITDYKSGSSKIYDSKDPFRQGRLIQHALYLSMVESRLREVASTQATASEFRFFFPDTRERGREIVFSPQQLRDGVSIVDNLCRILAGGCFPATDNSSIDCVYCPYTAVCQSPPETAARSRNKLANPGNFMLDPFRKLRERNGP